MFLEGQSEGQGRDLTVPHGICPRDSAGQCFSRCPPEDLGDRVLALSDAMFVLEHLHNLPLAEPFACIVSTISFTAWPSALYSQAESR